MSKEAKKPQYPFAKGYDFILRSKNLSAPEKLVMIQICRYWPAPCVQSNAKLAAALGYEARNIEKILHCLAIDKKVIKRGYTHVKIKGKPHTIRTIIPKCFARWEEADRKIQWVLEKTLAPVQLCAPAPVQLDAKPPSNWTPNPRPTGRPIRSLIRKGIEGAAATASAGPTPPLQRLPKAKVKSVPKAKLTTKEFHDRRERQKKALGV